jgi:hypothetical protein
MDTEPENKNTKEGKKGPALLFSAVLVFCVLLVFALAWGLLSHHNILSRSEKPIAFLHSLNRELTLGNDVLVYNRLENWVTKDDAIKLAQELNSFTRCSSIYTMASSFHPKLSTVGEQAGYLIYGYQAGRYPPSIDSSSHPSPEELRDFLDKENIPYPKFETWTAVVLRNRSLACSQRR